MLQFSVKNHTKDRKECDNSKVLQGVKIRTFAPVKEQGGKGKMPDHDGRMRLNRFIANSGVCSRREADSLITAGEIRVNGKKVSALGTQVRPGDTVTYRGRKLSGEKKVYVLLNKPKDCVTTVKDPQGRRTVLDLVKGCCEERIYPVGRLDRNTTGVLLLTNDGEMAESMTHPSFEQKKIYHIYLDRKITLSDLEKISEGLELEDGFIRPDAIHFADPADRKQVGMEIHSGRNRIVRRIFEHLGYSVSRLDRVYFAGLTKKGLARGKWRLLTEREVSRLKMMVPGNKPGRAKQRKK
jgi:23S rRNA pseudouridine2605 synthase